jgi:hypothetical protein
MLGDSMTFGYGVGDEETFSAVLEHLLNRVAPGAEVLNAGVTGTSNVQQIAYFWSEGVGYDPDYVVLNVCLANDLAQNWQDRDGPQSTVRYDQQQPMVIGASGILRSATPEQMIFVQPGPVQRLDELLYHHSRLYQRLTEGLFHSRRALALLEYGRLVRVTPFEYRPNRVLPPPQGSAEVEESCRLIREFDRKLGEKGIKLLVQPIPARLFEISDRERTLCACLESAGVELLDPEFFPLADRTYSEGSLSTPPGRCKTRKRRRGDRSRPFNIRSVLIRCRCRGRVREVETNLADLGLETPRQGEGPLHEVGPLLAQGL